MLSLPLLGRPGGFMQLPGWKRGRPCPEPATLLSQFHYDHNRAQFYVEDATTASALKQVSRKITDRDNYKVRASAEQGRSRSTQLRVLARSAFVRW